MNTIAQIFPRTGRISGPEVTNGAKPDVPTTDVENEKKKKKNTVYFYFIFFFLLLVAKKLPALEKNFHPETIGFQYVHFLLQLQLNLQNERDGSLLKTTPQAGCHEIA